MAAPKGNQFWKNRSSHGRKKLFETPGLMWEAACEYFEWCDKNPWVKTERVQSEKPSIKTIPTQRPYTLNALCLYLNANTHYFNDFKARLTENDNDFSEVIRKIEEVIYTQKFEGAAVGAFNANIIARDLGLKEKTDITSGDKPIEQVNVTFENYKKDE